MRFFTDNLVDHSDTVISAVSESAALPVENVAHELRGRIYRTGVSGGAERIIFDLGSAKEVTSAILLDHSFTAADIISEPTFAILEASTNNFASVAHTEFLTFSEGAILKTFAAQTYRYWRIELAVSPARALDVGRVYLGTYYETEEQPDFEGWGEKQEDPSGKQKTLGGQTYVDMRDQFRILEASFSKSPQTQVSELKAIFSRVGRATSFFVQADTVAPLDEVYYVKFTKALGPKVSGYDSQFYWDLELEMEEQL